MASMALNTPASFLSFGELLKYLRLRAQITQRDLAAKVGYNHAHLSRLENDQRIPDAATIRALFVPALELDDQPEWAARLVELAAQSKDNSQPGTEPATAAPATRAAWQLPIPFTALLGREQAVHLACEKVMRGDVRLMTFVGPPGIGKTRLALEVASKLQHQFGDGIVFVDLMPVRTAALVVPEVARALDVNEGVKDLSASLLAALRPRRSLLVLDNFEQIMDAAPLVLQWLTEAPSLKILVTSREPLHLSGEQEFSVPPLPEDAQVELFEQRAQAVQPAFVLTPENRPVIAEICRRLDGLPLAIELAAARIKQFSASAMMRRLDRRLQWLTGGARDGPAWRQTLRGAIDWSYNLLGPDQQSRWLAMSIFAGGYTAAAAEAVSGATLEELLSLSDKNLIAMMASAEEDEPRFTLLETLREYALERLTKDEAAHNAACEAHTAYYLGLVEAAELVSAGAELSEAVKQLELEYDNLRAALEWTVPFRPELGVRLVLSLGPFWYLRSHFREARHWQSMALSIADAAQRMALTRQLGETCWNLGEHQLAREYLEQGLALARASGDPDALAEGLNLLGRVVKDMGSFEEASGYFNEGLTLTRSYGNLSAQISLLRNLGNINLDRGDFEHALQYFEESLEAARGKDEPLGIAGALNNAGIAYLGMHDYRKAKSCFLEALPIFQEYGNQFGTALAIVNIGRVEHATGALEEARRNFETSLRLARETGRKWSIAYALSNLGLLACDWQNWGKAEEYFREAIAISLDASAAPRGLDALGSWAILLARTNRPEAAAELLGLVEKHRATEHESRERLRALRIELVAALPADVLAAALRRGEASSWEDAARRCLEEAPMGPDASHPD